MKELGLSGYLKIENADARNTVAGILFENGYTVSTVRVRKNRKSYVYLVKYETKERDIKEDA